jgi:hypothetical protein
MERETGIEPATNSLEGCDSTTELLPPSRRLTSAARRFGEAGPPTYRTPLTLRSTPPQVTPSTSRPCHERHQLSRSPPRVKRARRQREAWSTKTQEGRPLPTSLSAPNLRTARKGWWGGEGSNLRSPKAAGLQPAAIDRSATSPKLVCLSKAFRIRLRAGALAGVIHEPLS